LLIIVELLAITVETFLSKGYQFDQKRTLILRASKTKTEKQTSTTQSEQFQEQWKC
jgi:hypothetical protein